jgi:hypothetical protein
MKSVKNTPANLLLMTLLVSGCSRFQYFTISPQSEALNDFNRSFVVAENESIKIEYKFNGLNGPVNLTIHNKQNTPLYVNWEKSALIVNGKRFSYYNTNDEFNFSIDNTALHWNETVSTSSGSATGSIKRDETSSFIPPNSFITQSRLTLNSDFIRYPKKQFSKKNITSIDGRVIPVRYLRFTPENTPLKFRSYLTLSWDKQESELSIDNSFWVSEIMETLAEPGSLPREGNQFHVQKSTGFGQVMGITGLLTALTVVVIAAGE